MEDKVISQVYATNDYDKFKILTSNRNVNKLHVRRIRDSMYKKRLLCPIIVNERFEIIDGQHRYSALKEVGAPIEYIVVSGYGIYEVQVLNSNMKNWTQIDYLDAFCEMGSPPYILFKRFMDLYPQFSIKSAEVLARGKFSMGHRIDRELTGSKTGAIKIRKFEEGDFEFDDLAGACERAEMVLAFKDVYPYFTNDKVIRAIIHMNSIAGYDNQRMVSKFEINGGPYKRYANTRQYLEFFEEIYNYRSQNKISLRML